MIAFEAPNQFSATDGSFASERFRQPPALEQAISSVEPDLDRLQAFPLRQRFIGLGRSWKPLRLLSDPMLRLDTARETVTVEGWGITVDHTNDALTTVPHLMARRFMKLWQDAENNRLAEGDKKDWFSITSAVDADAFHRSLERPRYLEGQIAGSKHQRIIRWPGEEGICKVPRELSGEFALFEKDEWFGGYFMLNENDEIISIERVVPVPVPEENMFENWPPVAP